MKWLIWVHLTLFCLQSQACWRQLFFFSREKVLQEFPKKTAKIDRAKFRVNVPARVHSIPFEEGMAQAVQEAESLIRLDCSTVECAFENLWEVLRGLAKQRTKIAEEMGVARYWRYGLEIKKDTKDFSNEFIRVSDVLAFYLADDWEGVHKGSGLVDPIDSKGPLSDFLHRAKQVVGERSTYRWIQEGLEYEVDLSRVEKDPKGEPDLRVKHPPFYYSRLLTDHAVRNLAFILVGSKPFSEVKNTIFLSHFLMLQGPAFFNGTASIAHGFIDAFLRKKFGVTLPPLKEGMDPAMEALLVGKKGARAFIDGYFSFFKAG